MGGRAKVYHSQEGPARLPALSLCDRALGQEGSPAARLFGRVSDDSRRGSSLTNFIPIRCWLNFAKGPKSAFVIIIPEQSKTKCVYQLDHRLFAWCWLLPDGRRFWPRLPLRGAIN